MTVINDTKILNGRGTDSTVPDCSNSICGMNCCAQSASSDISLDGNVPSSSTSNSNSTTRVTDFTGSAYESGFSRCEKVNIEFENLKYTVSKFSFSNFKFETKQILRGINGTFRSGELTAIMGPSGAGKSTLLNVMSGYCYTGTTGTVRVNGKEVSTSTQSYRELSCYIHQEDLLRQQLKVGEAMMLAAHLKLGFKISKQRKLNLVKHILSLLGLDHRFNVFAAKLSGGQKKRLAIALELISNPSVLYLDEPTTGLDSSSCSRCIGLLKKLAAHGHTIVCTIHQPSALVFEMFDKLYTVVDGQCMYQGPVRELVPFLADQNLLCPSYHNPADFLLEVAVGDYERDLDRLFNAANKKYFEDSDSQINHVSQIFSNITADNGVLTIGSKLAKVFNTEPENLQLASYDYVKPSPNDLALEELQGLNETKNINKDRKQQKHHKFLKAESPKTIDGTKVGNASFLMQYLLLMQRILKSAQRNYFLLMARVLSHVIIGAIFGYLYNNVGEKANTVLGNYVYMYGTTLLLVYTGKMSVVLTFPLEIGMLSREYFNRWYNLGPYFLSLLSFEIPFQSLCAVLYTTISIYLTSNYNGDNLRVCYFLLFTVLATLSAQAWGFFVGSTLPTKLAVFLGPIVAVLFSVFGFCTRYIDITPLFRWMWHISYFRAGFHGTLNSIYGMDRAVLECPDNVIYCHFRSPKVFLDYMMITDVNMANSIVLMLSIIGVMHLLTIIRLWHTLNKR